MRIRTPLQPFEDRPMRHDLNYVVETESDEDGKVFTLTFNTQIEADVFLAGVEWVNDGDLEQLEDGEDLRVLRFREWK